MRLVEPGPLRKHVGAGTQRNPLHNTRDPNQTWQAREEVGLLSGVFLP